MTTYINDRNDNKMKDNEIKNTKTVRSTLTVTDMTTGEPMRLIIQFFFPVFLGNLFQQLYSMVDTIVVGKGIGDHALAAVGASGSINFFLLGFMIGLSSGMGILMSQAFGAGNITRLRRLTAMSVFVSLVLGLTVTIFSLLFIEHYFVLMDTPADIMDGALKYFRVILFGITITMGNNLCLNILRALGDSKTPLRAMILSSLINIVLDILFIMGLKTGVAGASIATLIAQICSILYCFRIIRKMPELKLEADNWKIRPVLIRQLFVTGLPVACMNSVTAVGRMVLQYFVNQMGSIAVAAYAACNKITALAQQPGQAVGLTLLTYVGQNLGAGRYDRIKIGVKRGMVLSILVNIPMVSLMVFTPGMLASIVLSEQDTIALTLQYFPIAGICIFLLGWLFVFRSSCQGMGQTVVPMFSGILEVMMRVGLVLICGFLPGFYRIVTAEVAAWIAAWLMLMFTYFHIMKKHSSQIQ